MSAVAVEMELLVACLPGGSSETAGQDQIAALLARDSLNWVKLIELAGHHGFLPLLCEQLGKQSSGASKARELLPAELRSRLAERQRRHARASLCAAGAVIELATRFRERGLRAVCWKGPVLAQELMGSCLLRECGDLDFLISPRQIVAAIEEVEDAGFTRHFKSATPSGRDAVAEMDQEFCFFRERDNIYIELHTATMPSRLPEWQSTAWLLERARPTIFRGFEVLALGPEDLLLSLCGHGTKHHWERLKWVADIALFLEVYEGVLDWTEIVAEARRTHRLPALLHACELAARIFSRELPQVLARELQSQRMVHLGELTGRIAELRMCGETGPPCDRDIAQQLGLLCAGRQDRMRLWLRRLQAPALEDLVEGKPRLGIWTKWRRLHRRLGWWGIVEKARASLRTT